MLSDFLFFSVRLVVLVLDAFCVLSWFEKYFQICTWVVKFYGSLQKCGLTE